MANPKSYNELRSANLHENRRMLEELGVRMPRIGEMVMLNKAKVPRKQPKQKITIKVREAHSGEENDGQKDDELGRSGSRSFRVRLKTRNYQDEEEDYYMYKAPKPRIPCIRPNPTYGSVPGVEVGREWATRMECSSDLIHRPTVAGIHAGPDGAYSVALSGGYEDDVDFGESFTYTGEGGRDLKGTKDKPKNLRTAPQSKDQTLDRGNLALSRSVETQTPVRVVRGYKLDSQYAPEDGYRYDGLYQVKKYWAAMGKSGFKVFKFAFVRCDPEPAPWVNMPFGMLGSPTSPTTPASIPRTGVEACEAPSLDADDSEDNSQLEEAKIGARQPDDRKRPKKKVSFNPEDSIRIFEPENDDGRVTRSSRARELESSDSEEEEVKAPQVRERSKRTVKPTAKVRDNLCLGTVKGSKLSSSPIALVTDSSKSTEENGSSKSTKDDTVSPKKPSSLVKSDTSSPKKSELNANEKNSSKDKARSRSPSPEEGSGKSPKSNQVKMKKSPANSPKEKCHRRSFSPDYPSSHVNPPNSPPKLSPKSADEKAFKRSLSPEFPLEEISPVRRGRGRPKKRPLSPENGEPENPTPSKGRGRPRKQPATPEDAKPEISPIKERRFKRSVSPEFLPQKEKPGISPASRGRGRPRKRSVSPAEKRSKLSPKEKEPQKSPGEKPRSRPVSPEYPPTDKKPGKSNGKTGKTSLSPENRRKDAKEGHSKKSSPKNSSDSRTPPQKGTPKKRVVSPDSSPKHLDRRSKSSSPNEEKHPKKTKSPSNPLKKEKLKNESSKSPKNSSKELTNAPSKKSPSSKPNKKSPEKKTNSPKSSSDKTAKVQKKGKTVPVKSPKLDSPKQQSESAEKYSNKRLSEEMISPKTQTKKSVKESKTSTKRPLSPSDEEATDIQDPSKKKSRFVSPKSATKEPMKEKEPGKEKEDERQENEISDDDFASGDVGDVSPDWSGDEASGELEKRSAPNTTLAVKPETKTMEEEVLEALTPPETETSNSPNPTPPGSSSSVNSLSGAPAREEAKPSENLCDNLDDDEFPSDDEIMNMMQLSLGACSADGPKITVKMVNGKWVEMEEPDTSSKINASNKSIEPR